MQDLLTREEVQYYWVMERSMSLASRENLGESEKKRRQEVTHNNESGKENLWWYNFCSKVSCCCNKLPSLHVHSGITHGRERLDTKCDVPCYLLMVFNLDVFPKDLLSYKEPHSRGRTSLILRQYSVSQSKFIPSHVLWAWTFFRMLLMIRENEVGSKNTKTRWREEEDRK